MCSGGKLRPLRHTRENRGGVRHTESGKRRKTQELRRVIAVAMTRVIA